MFATITRRTLIAVPIVMAAWLSVGATGAVAQPPPVQPSGLAACPMEVSGFAAQLRADGLSAQAANNAAQLTVRDCIHSS
jgi:hypothetical protein